MTDLIKKQLELESLTQLSSVKKKMKPIVEETLSDFIPEEFFKLWVSAINLETYEPKCRVQKAFLKKFIQNLTDEQIGEKLKELVINCTLNLMCVVQGGVTLQSLTQWVMPAEVRNKIESINTTIGAAPLVAALTKFWRFSKLVTAKKMGEEGVMFFPTQIFAKQLKWVQHPLPMLYKPKEVSSLHQSGYLTTSAKGCLGGHPLMKQGQNVSFDILNLVNRTAFIIDEQLFTEFHDSQKESVKFADRVKKMSQEDGELFKITFAAYQEQQRNFIDHMRENGVKEIYFTSYFDHRGRLYTKGFQFSFQGNAFQKAILKINPININKQLEEELRQQQQKAIEDGWEF